jgi:hypothetical protein
MQPLAPCVPVFATITKISEAVAKRQNSVFMQLDPLPLLEIEQYCFLATFYEGNDAEKAKTNYGSDYHLPKFTEEHRKAG